MTKEPKAPKAPSEPSPIWTPLSRADLEACLEKHNYTNQHLTILSWLIWLPLLSGDELLRVLSRTERHLDVAKGDLAEHLKSMASLGLIETIRLREPSVRNHQRYYATDLGLYLYLSAVHSFPPLSIARLVRSYPVEREDLLARLARPHIHLACMSLVTRIIAEEETRGNHLVSYQQPWQHITSIAQKRYLICSDAALLLEHHASRAHYAFLIHVDVEPHQKEEREVEKWLLSLLDLRQSMRLSRQHWPELLIISTRNRLPLWAHLLLETSFKRVTKPLAGGITTLDALSRASTPWWDFAMLTTAEHPDQVDQVSLEHLLREPASLELIELFSKQRHLYEMRLKEAASPPPRTRKRLQRYVGNTLQDEADHLTREHLEALFGATRKSRQSVEGAGLLTLALTATEKEMLGWAAHHPLLDVLTLQALLRPAADPQAIKPLQQRISHLFKLGLIETRLWSRGKTPLEQQRYLLTSVAVKFIATRHGEPFSVYFVPPKYQKGDDEQLDRQWGTRGLNAQMNHTHGLYAFMRQLYRGTHARGEIIYHWKSAHEAARWYRDTISQDDEHARPDAELVFALSPIDQPVRMVLLEYDRGTTGAVEYSRKFTAYLDYQQATGKALPLLVVTSSRKATERMQHVLDTLQGSLPVIILLEEDLLAHGLALVLHHFPP
ncbi:hypothetical protein ccbrp13_60610 [Ktedonobacteria bacterium brp13]|nr:hypothetical protein ccbrp13_60610 [Ktedonobacteria bacterium brp13]